MISLRLVINIIMILIFTVFLISPSEWMNTPIIQIKINDIFFILFLTSLVHYIYLIKKERI